jgi:hypothetical protein
MENARSPLSSEGLPLQYQAVWQTYCKAVDCMDSHSIRQQALLNYRDLLMARAMNEHLRQQLDAMQHELTGHLMRDREALITLIEKQRELTETTAHCVSLGTDLAALKLHLSRLNPPPHNEDDFDGFER